MKNLTSILLNHIWGSIITIFIYAICVVFFYQVLFEYKNYQISIFISAPITILIRFIIAKILQNVEVDFNIYRETLCIIISILTIYFYENYFN